MAWGSRMKREEEGGGRRRVAPRTPAAQSNSKQRFADAASTQCEAIERPGGKRRCVLAGGAGWVPTVSSNVASRALGRTSMAAYCSTENIPRAESSLGRVRRRDAMLEHGRAAESEAAGSGERAHRRGSEGHEENARDQPHFRTEVLPCSDPRDDSFNSYKLSTVGVLPRAAQPTTEPNPKP